MSTLNEKIKKIIEGSVYTDYFFNGEDEIPSDYVEKDEAALFLEVLVIQEKIDFIKDAEKLLDRAYGFNHEDMGWDVDFEDWKNKVKELTQQLKQLQP